MSSTFIPEKRAEKDPELGVPLMSATSSSREPSADGNGTGTVVELTISPENAPTTHQMHVKDFLHSISSYTVMIYPVAATMLIASFAVVNIEDKTSAAGAIREYLIYDNSSESQSSSEKLEEAVINSLAIVSAFLVMTFVIVLCYKLNCMKFLIGYMLMSCSLLLGFMGGYLAFAAISELDAAVDVVSYVFVLYNFAIVGVTAIFYQKGCPVWLTQSYLVAVSVIMAWQLAKFPEWTTWSLLVVLGFYDLCAVLTPCGPLKCLVNLVQSEGRPLPGLLYEAEVPQIGSAAAERPCKEDTAALNSQRTPLLAPSGSSGNSTAPPSLSEASLSSTSFLYYQHHDVARSEEGDGDGDVEDPSDSNETSVMVPKYGGVSSTSVSRPTTSSLSTRDRLEMFYQKFNPSALSRVDAVLARYAGRERELWRDLKQKYVTPLIEEMEEDRTIKLGLGDFVFYSVLVSRAAMFDFSTMTGCLVVVLSGLGGTLILLSVFQKALPALPISIFLSVAYYFAMRLSVVPLIDFVSASAVYM